MKRTVLGKIMVLALMLGAVLILVFSDFGKQGRVYDCGMAEWHPDIPADVKQECRKLRYEHWQRENNIHQSRPLTT